MNSIKCNHPAETSVPNKLFRDFIKMISQLIDKDKGFLRILTIIWLVLLLVNFNIRDVNANSNSSGQDKTEITKSNPSLFYTVQIGVFKNTIDDEIFEDYQPLIKAELPNGMVRYSVGVFQTVNEAVNELNQIIESGISDAFLTAYYNGVRIPLNEARRISTERDFTEDSEFESLISNITAKGDTILTLKTDSVVVKLGSQLPDTVGTRKLISDHFYSVQIGVLSIGNDFEETIDLRPLLKKELPNDIIRYSIGVFNTKSEANKLLPNAVESGFADAFVAQYPIADYPNVFEDYSHLFTVDTLPQEVTTIQRGEEFQSDDNLVEEADITDVEDEVDSLAESSDSIDEREDLLSDLELSSVSTTGLLYVNSTSKNLIRVVNNGPDGLPAGSMVQMVYSGINIQNIYCSDISRNQCVYPKVVQQDIGADIILPEMESNGFYEMWIEIEPLRHDERVELVLSAIVAEGVTDISMSNNSIVLPFIISEPETQETDPLTDVVLDSRQDIEEVQPSRIPFLITIDGEPLLIDETSLDRNDRERINQYSNQRLPIEIRADHRERTPVLNITAPRAAVRGQPIFFHGYSNYNDWIDRYELRIFDRFTPSTGNPIALISPADETGTLFRWTGMVSQDVDVVNFVLRVYDEDGNFDETLPRELPIVDRRRPDRDLESDQREARVGYGENSRSIANIQVNGGAVTVFGDELHPNATVLVDDIPIHVDERGRFVSRQLKVPGNHLISISIDDPEHGYTYQNHEIYMPNRDWFQLAVADFTAGLGSVSGPASLVTGNNTARYRGDQYVEGRLAFYLKGDLSRKTQITASADTREQPVSQLFTNFTERDPQALLRRLDSNYSYPVYGDDGILVDDAPTQGKFHVRLEREDSRLMWGSFRTPVAGTDLVQFNRGLYGAELHHRSLSSTRFGERKTMADAFAADPGTVGSREEFRATGGSLYYLRNQDLLWGSERIFVEVRDRESDLVIETITLQPHQDYEINALQGRIILSRPLSSIQEGQGLVRTGAVSGNPVYLVAHYEYTPSLVRLDNFTLGGRVSQWFGDYLQVGLTGYSQQGMQMEQDIYGGDVTLRYKPGTYLRVEHANSDGRGAPIWSSIDGGFGFSQIVSSADQNSEADAQRVEMAVDFSEFGREESTGKLNAYIQKRGNGFSAPGQLNTEEITQGGVQARLPFGSRLALTAKGDLMDGSRSGESRAVEAGAEVFITKRIYVQGGARNEYRETSLMGGNSQRLSETGQRTDAVGLLGYQSVSENGAKGPFNIYAIYQGTVDKDAGRRSNDRYGLGGGLRISDRVTISGEATDGDGGWGGKAETEFNLTERSSIYINYLMDPDRTDQGIRGRSGNLTTGGRVRYSESTNVFLERRQETSEIGPSGLIHAFGLDFAPSERWSYGLKLESGNLSDAVFGDVERKAASIFTGYTSESLRWGGSVEYRSDDSSETGPRESWLMRNSLGLKLSDGWRLLGRANIAISDGGEGTVMDAEYTELVTGLAYRPSFNNRMNALFRYSYLYDLASPDQLGPRLQLNPYAQKSHVFSADAIFKITRHLSLGGKIGHRRGELRDRTIEGSEWFGSSSWLYIARADVHVVKAWDVIAEYRRLEVEESRDVRDGYLVGIYRHVTTNLRLGLGYNFTDYTDDLTDLSFRSEGWFVNLIGMF